MPNHWLRAVGDAHGQVVGDPGDGERDQPQERAAVDEDQQEGDDGGRGVEQRAVQGVVDLTGVGGEGAGAADLDAQAVSAVGDPPYVVDECVAGLLVLTGLGGGDRVHEGGAVLGRDAGRTVRERVRGRDLGDLVGGGGPVGGGQSGVAVVDDDHLGGLAARQPVLDLRDLGRVGARRQVVDGPVPLHVRQVRGERRGDRQYGDPQSEHQPGNHPAPPGARRPVCPCCPHESGLLRSGCLVAVPPDSRRPSADASDARASRRLLPRVTRGARYSPGSNGEEHGGRTVRPAAKSTVPRAKRPHGRDGQGTMGGTTHRCPSRPKRTSMAAWSTRTAASTDRDQLIALLTDSCDTAVIPAPALIDEAVESRWVRVAEREGTLVGCLVAEAPSPGHVRVVVIAVRSDSRRQGVAARLLSETVRACSGRADETPLVSVLADPRDVALSRLLLGCGFLGTRLLRSSGPGTAVHLHYQHKSRVAYLDPDARHLVPVGDQEQLAESLAPSDHAVTAVVPPGRRAGIRDSEVRAGRSGRAAVRRGGGRDRLRRVDPRRHHLPPRFRLHVDPFPGRRASAPHRGDVQHGALPDPLRERLRRTRPDPFETPSGGS